LIERGTEPSQNDPIASLLGQVQPVLEEIDRTVLAIRQLADTLNRNLQGQGQGPLASSLNDVAGATRRVNALLAQLEAIAANLQATSAGLRDPTGLVKRLLDPKGSVATILDDNNQLYDRILGSIEELNAVIAQLAAFTRFVNTTQPQILGLLEQGRATLDQGQEVLEAVKNNPLLRGGVPPRREQQTTFQSFRDEDF
jgi:phospholipid/cholesterol/gamma-HCH transport system substrate-binding protein